MTLDVVSGIRSRLAPRLKTAMLRTGGYSMLRALAPSQGVAILRYHAICDENGYAYADPGISVSPSAFAAHVEYLAKHYNVMRLEEIVDRLRTARPLPHNCVAITFDDGYADNLEAARVLHKNGVSATFYITAGCLHEGAPFWPSEVRYLVHAIKSSSLSLSVAGEIVDLPLYDAQERQRTIKRLNRLFKSNRIAVRENLREQLRSAAGHPALPRHMLTWDELAEMVGLEMTIGAHTVTHANLPSAGLADATSEIQGSKARLERELGVPITMFSFPNGGAETYFNRDLQEVVARAGFAAAASSRNAFAGRGSDLYALERIEIEERLEDLAFALEVERFAFAPRA